jgi:hypothetical protein
VHTYHRLSHVFHSLNFSSPQEDEDEGEEEERKDLTKEEDEKRYGIIILHQNCLKLFYFIF